MQLPEGLVRDGRLTDSAVLVASWVAQFGGAGCYAHEATIARELGYADVRTAGRALAALERAGWMRPTTTIDGRHARTIAPARPGQTVNLPRTLLRPEAILRACETRVYALARHWLETGRPVTAARLTEALPHTNLRTAKTHLRTLVDSGLLLRVGQGRATRYRLAETAKTPGHGTFEASYPQDVTKGCKSRPANPVDTTGMVQIEAPNGANRGTRNGANRAPREGTPSLEGVPEGSPVVTVPSSLQVVTADAGTQEGKEHDIEHTAEQPNRAGGASEPAATTARPETSDNVAAAAVPSPRRVPDPGADTATGESEAESEAQCYQTAHGIVSGLSRDTWPLTEREARWLVNRLAQVLRTEHYETSQLAHHLVEIPPPSTMGNAYAVLSARLRPHNLPTHRRSAHEASQQRRAADDAQLAAYKADQAAALSAPTDPHRTARNAAFDTARRNRIAAHEAGHSGPKTRQPALPAHHNRERAPDAA